MATKAKNNKSVKNEVKNEMGKYVKCDFSVLSQTKTLDELKLWANDMAAQLKAQVNAEQERLAKSVTKKAETETKKAEKKTTKKAEKKSAKKAKKTRSLAKEIAQVSIEDKKALKELGVKFLRYTEKSCVLVGDTKALHDSLLENFYGLKCITMKQGEMAGQKGWIFSNARAEQFAKISGMKYPKAAAV